MKFSNVTCVIWYLTQKKFDKHLRILENIEEDTSEADKSPSSSPPSKQKKDTCYLSSENYKSNFEEHLEDITAPELVELEEEIGDTVQLFSNCQQTNLPTIDELDEDEIITHKTDDKTRSQILSEELRRIKVITNNLDSLNEDKSRKIEELTIDNNYLKTKVKYLEQVLVKENNNKTTSSIIEKKLWTWNGNN